MLPHPDVVKQVIIFAIYVKEFKYAMSRDISVSFNID